MHANNETATGAISQMPAGDKLELSRTDQGFTMCLIFLVPIHKSI